LEDKNFKVFIRLCYFNFA